MVDYMKVYNEFKPDKRLTLLAVQKMVGQALADEMKWEPSDTPTEDRVEMGMRVLKLFKEFLERKSRISIAIDVGVFEASQVPMSYVYSSQLFEELLFVEMQLAMLWQLMIDMNLSCEHTLLLLTVSVYV